MTEEISTTEASSDLKSDWLEWRCWKVFGGVMSVLTLTIAAAGLYYVIVELRHDIELRRSDIALGFVERFNSGAYVEARNEVLRPWLKYQAQLGLANKFDGLSKDQIEQLTNLIVRQDRSAGGDLETHIITLANFFDELAICVENRIWDCGTARDYFQTRARDLGRLYGPVLTTLEAAFDLNNAGSGLTAIAELDEAACDALG